MQTVLLLKWITRSSTEGHFDSHFKIILGIIQTQFRVVTLELDDLSTAEKFSIIKHVCVTESISHIHLDWLTDIEFFIAEFDDLARDLGIGWSSLGHLSGILRSRASFSEKMLHHQVNGLLCSKALRGILVWDEFLPSIFPPLKKLLVPIPDVQDTSVQSEYCSFCKKIEKSNGKLPVIGVIGQLYGFRGSDKLLRITPVFKRTYRLFLAGIFYKETHSSLALWKLSILKLIRKVHFHRGFIESNELLNHYISHLSALYIDTENYKSSSGIAQRALQLGVPVIIEKSDSCLNDRAKLSEGYILRAENADLALDLQRINSRQISNHAGGANEKSLALTVLSLLDF